MSYLSIWNTLCLLIGLPGTLSSFRSSAALGSASSCLWEVGSAPHTTPVPSCNMTQLPTPFTSLAILASGKFTTPAQSSLPLATGLASPSIQCLPSPLQLLPHTGHWSTISDRAPSLLLAQPLLPPGTLAPSHTPQTFCISWRIWAHATVPSNTGTSP